MQENKSITTILKIPKRETWYTTYNREFEATPEWWEKGRKFVAGINTLGTLFADYVSKTLAMHLNGGYENIIK